MCWLAWSGDSHHTKHAACGCGRCLWAAISYAFIDSACLPQSPSLVWRWPQEPKHLPQVTWVRIPPAATPTSCMSASCPPYKTPSTTTSGVVQIVRTQPPERGSFRPGWNGRPTCRRADHSRRLSPKRCGLAGAQMRFCPKNRRPAGVYYARRVCPGAACRRRCSAAPSYPASYAILYSDMIPAIAGSALMPA